MGLNLRLVPTFDGIHAGELEPCPMCLRRVAFGAGVMRGWHRLHDWCKPAVTITKERAA